MGGKTIVVTGASDGIGAAAARRLARDGHRVVVVGRSPEKTAKVASDIGAEHLTADFARLSDVAALAARLLESCERIDVLANNAGGIFGKTPEVTDDGHEVTFQVNYLAPFYLTELLRGRLIESGATVINTSSVGHSLFGRLDEGDLETRRSYNPRLAYGNAKLAQILHARELDRRFAAEGLSAVSFHPGNIATSFARDPGSGLGFVYGTPLKRVFLSSPEKGADTLVYLAEARARADFPGGEYFVRRAVARPNPQARDPQLARTLWERTMAMLRPLRHGG